MFVPNWRRSVPWAAFSESVAPRMSRTFVDLDYRDHPGNTRGGGRILFQVGTGRDQDPSREFSYRRTDLEFLHVFPIFDKKRNFAVHVAASHVDPLNANGRLSVETLKLSPNTKTLSSSTRICLMRSRPCPLW